MLEQLDKRSLADNAAVNSVFFYLSLGTMLIMRRQRLTPLLVFLVLLRRRTPNGRLG